MLFKIQKCEYNEVNDISRDKQVFNEQGCQSLIRHSHDTGFGVEGSCLPKCFNTFFVIYPVPYKTL